MEARRIKQLRSRWTVNRWGCICKEDGSLRENLGYAEFLEEGKQVLIFSIRVCAGQSRIAGSYAVPFHFFFFGISILFSTLTEPTYIPTNMVVGFSFLHVLSDTCHSTSFEWQWFWKVWDMSNYGLICISLMLSDAECLFICLLTIYVLGKMPI